MLQELKAAPAQPSATDAADEPAQPSVDAERCHYLHRHLPELTPTERMVYDLYLQGKSTAQVLEEMNITQNTLKYHNRNIYGKLGVANRKELQALIESKGGKVTGSVTAKTHYLINNDVTSNSSKNKKAKELGVAIISEVDFLEMIGQEV